MIGKRSSVRGVWLRAVRGAACMGLIATMPIVAFAADTAEEKSEEMTLKGGDSGTVFKSLTVEGENRIRIEIARPKLQLDLDPRSAPGLELGSIESALEYDRPGLISPLYSEVAARPSPYTARPWLDGFATGPVARFNPNVTEVDRWRLVVADSRGQEVAAFEGKGRPKKEIVWDGRAADGSMALPGLTYTYVFQAMDRAGNRRNFVGEGFSVPAYRRGNESGISFVFSGRSPGLSGLQPAGRGAVPAMLKEVASRLHQSASTSAPIRVRVVAKSFEEGDALGRNVASSLAELLLGEHSRVMHTVDVAADAPAGGTVIVSSEPSES